MNVEKIMNSKVIYVDANMSVKDAAMQMLQFNFDTLPVSENDKLIGMLNERDILMAMMDEKDLSKTMVREVMHKDVCFCMENDDLQKASRMMCENKMRGLPVVGDDMHIEGFVSIDDFVKTAHDEKLAYQILDSITSLPQE